MKEKVLHVELPENEKSQKVIVTEEGKIDNVCSAEITESFVTTEIASVEVKIQKPKKLIGGTEVYQKDGVPYWYCKIKNGRDEFMHLPMNDLTEQDLLYDSKTGSPREFVTKVDQIFKDNVLKALARKPEEGFRWIPVFEPSCLGTSRLKFVKGELPFIGRSAINWEMMAKDYSPENESCISSKTTCFLLLLRWLKDGIATLEELVNDSTSIGHYIDSEDAKHKFELTGERMFGGLYGFVGNTCKVIKDPDAPKGFSMLGGSSSNPGKGFPIANILNVTFLNSGHNSCVGIIELKK